MENFLKHLQLEQPQFECVLPSDSSKTLLIDVHHQLQTGASPKEIQQLQQGFAKTPQQLVNLYQQYNGLSLYCYTYDSALYFPSIGAWQQLNDNWKTWFDNCSPEELKQLPLPYKKGIAFAELSNTGSYFILFEEQVYYFEPSNFMNSNQVVLAPSIAAFLDLIAHDPINFFKTIDCFPHYWDEQTDQQWIPKTFITNP